jgi:hypothetical protein
LRWGDGDVESTTSTAGRCPPDCTGLPRIPIPRPATSQAGYHLPVQWSARAWGGAGLVSVAVSPSIPRTHYDQTHWMGDRLGTGVKAIRASEERLAAKGTSDRDVELPARHRTRSWWAGGRGRWDRAGGTAGTSCLCHPHLPRTGDRRTLPVGAERPPLGPVPAPTSAWPLVLVAAVLMLLAQHWVLPAPLAGMASGLFIVRGRRGATTSRVGRGGGRTPRRSLDRAGRPSLHSSQPSRRRRWSATTTFRS